MQQSSSIDFKLVQRVCLLQQALDQALGSLDELKAQVKDKQWVETQLANTEKYANVQQQAIAHLKQQLAQYAEVQNDLLRVMGHRLNELIDQQQQAFGQLNLHFQQSSSELQGYLQYLGRQRPLDQAQDLESEAHRLALEAEVMVARSMAVHLSQHLGLAKQQLTTLKSELGNDHLNLNYIIRTIQAMIADLESFEGVETTPSSHSAKAVTSATAETPRLAPAVEVAEVGEAAEEEPDQEALQAVLRRQGLQIHELETMLVQQVEYSTQVRQRYQAIAAERDYYKRELEKLRQGEPTPPSAEPLEPLAELPLAEPPPPTLPPKGYERRGRSQPIQPLIFPEEWD